MQNWYLRSKSRYAEYVRFNKVIDNRIAPNFTYSQRGSLQNPLMKLHKSSVRPLIYFSA